MIRDLDKKEYISPIATVECFTIDCVISTSGGQGQFDDEGGDLDAVGEADAVVVDTYTGEVKYYLDENADVLDAADVESIY